MRTGDGTVVAQIFNLRYRRIGFCPDASGVLSSARESFDALPMTNPRYSTARRSRNQNGARLFAKHQPRHSGSLNALRLGLRPQPRSEESSRRATISSDTDRARSSRNQNTPQRRDERREGTSSANLCVRPVSAVPFPFRKLAQRATILADTGRVQLCIRRALPNSGSWVRCESELPGGAAWKSADGTRVISLFRLPRHRRVSSRACLNGRQSISRRA
jgi:hypothetical protein